MDGYLDSDYQPPRAFNRKRVQERTIDEFVGICKGLLADERLSGKDVDFLRGWMFHNKSFFALGFERELYNKVMSALEESGTVADMDVLYKTLADVYGGKTDGFLAHSLSTKIPFTTPVPAIMPGMSLCFTGKMSYGPRKICIAMSEARGFICTDEIVTDLECLVIGKIGRQTYFWTQRRNDGHRVVEDTYLWSAAIKKGPFLGPFFIQGGDGVALLQAMTPHLLFLYRVHYIY